MTDQAVLDIGNFTTATSLGSSPTTYPWVTATGNYTFPRPVRFIRSEDGGTVKYTDAFGNTATAKFKAGETRALVAQGIVLTGTTSTDLEGVV